jgi:transposase InsO family protein
MGFRTVSATHLATLFCLAVVRQRWPGQIPTLTDAARELGISRELASRLRARLFDRLLELIERVNRPGPKTRDPELVTTRRRLHLLEALLGVARTIIAAAGIAVLSTLRRQELVAAVEQLHALHGVAFDQVAEELGLAERTLRRLRAQAAAGDSLAPRSRAPKAPHGKLPQPLADAVVTFVSLFPGVPLAELHRRFIKEKATLCAEYGHARLACTTFAHHSGRSRKAEAKTAAACPPRRGRDAPENLPFRAVALMDTTDIECFGFIFQLIPFMEGHSRDIFAHQLCDQEKAEWVKRVLDEGVEKTGGVLALRVDRGTPYLAVLTVEEAEKLGVEMRVARAYTPTDKAVLERFHRTLKDALRSIFECINLREGPGEEAWRRELARQLASAVIAGYLRWGYPYIPQPYIDGRSPRERVEEASQAGLDIIRDALDERVRHHEHAQTVARELHAAYDFRWSIGRWLAAVRRYTAEDLREGARRFEQTLLRGCFNCDGRRTPPYLLAIVRRVAEERQARERRARHAQARTAQRCIADAAEARALREDEHRREVEPEAAARQAVELARVALTSHGGYGLTVAQRWLDQALQRIASRGGVALGLVAARLRAMADGEELRAWVAKGVVRVEARPTTVRSDLSL